MVIVSHAHYDHLDTKTLDRLPNKSSITVIVPLGLGKYFTKRNYGKVHEVDWYDNIEVGDLSVTAVTLKSPTSILSYQSTSWTFP